MFVNYLDVFSNILGGGHRLREFLLNVLHPLVDYSCQYIYQVQLS